MPKWKITLYLRAYEKDNVTYSELALSDYSYSKIFEMYLEYVELLLKGEFLHYYRFDLCSPSRLLFSSCALRSFVDQKNLTINFNPF